MPEPRAVAHRREELRPRVRGEQVYADSRPRLYRRVGGDKAQVDVGDREAFGPETVAGLVTATQQDLAGVLQSAGRSGCVRTFIY
jgi:hypothetical protein